jgi:hypothetical protein
VTAWKCAKTSPRTLATKELAIASRHCTISHFLFTGEFLTKKNDCHPPPTLLFSVSLIEGKTERPPFCYNWGDRGRIADSAEHPHRIGLPGCI